MRVKSQDVLGFLSLAVFILTLSISLVIVFTPIYAGVSKHLGLADQLGLSQDQLMENYHQLLVYLCLPWVNQLVLPDFASSSSGLFHFWEVKRLFLLNAILLLLSATGSFFYLRSIRRQGRYYVLKRFFSWGLVVPFVLLFLIFANFDWLFIKFHELFFNNDAWVFNPQTDPIILALPQEFFMVCFACVFVLILLFFLIGYLWARKKARS